MKYLYKLSVFITIIFLFIFQTNNLLAKSTNKNEFLKLAKKAEQLDKSQNKRTKEGYLLRLKIENDFNISKLKIDNKARGHFYFYVCDGARIFNWTAKRLDKVIYYCSKSYENYNKAKYFKNKESENVELYLSEGIASFSAWRYLNRADIDDKKKLRNM